MKVILTENVSNLGNVGEIVNVSQGFARNYLIPKNVAVLADEKNKRVLEDEKKRLSKKVEETKKQAMEMKGKVDGLELEFFRRVAGNGKLFGAVSASDISKALEEKGITVEKRLIQLDQPAKTTGTFNVTVNFFDDVQGQLKIRVEMEPKQVEEIKRKQEAAEKKKKERAEAKASGEEQGEDESENKAPEEKTEQQILDEQTNKIFRDM